MRSLHRSGKAIKIAGRNGTRRSPRVVVRSFRSRAECQGGASLQNTDRLSAGTGGQASRTQIPPIPHDRDSALPPQLKATYCRSWLRPANPVQRTANSERFRVLPPPKRLFSVGPNRIYHGSNLRTHRREQPGGMFGVTKCLQPRRPAIDLETASLIVSTLRFSVENWGVDIGAYVVLPDHFHVLAGIPQTMLLTHWMHRIMSFVGKKSDSRLRIEGTRWQRDFHDREVRSKRHHDYLIDYYHSNPVRAGLVRFQEEWEASSVHRPSWVGPLWF